MKRKIFLSITFSIWLCLIGCSNLQKLNLEATNVILTRDVPKTCQFLGNIVNLNVHENLDIRSSLKDIKTDDVNFLKNEGAKRGANVVMLQLHKSNASPPQYRKGISGPIIIYEHYVSANAYRCSSKILLQLKQNEFNLQESALFQHAKNSS